jgi:hypothetical protein
MDNNNEIKQDNVDQNLAEAAKKAIKAQRHKEALKRYYEKHKNEKQVCEICLGKISFSNVYHHRTSNRHLAWVEKRRQEAEAKAAAEATEKTE